MPIVDCLRVFDVIDRFIEIRGVEVRRVLWVKAAIWFVGAEFDMLTPPACTLHSWLPGSAE